MPLPCLPSARAPSGSPFCALAWWATGLVLALSALLLVEPSAQLYLAVAQSGAQWPERLADPLIITLCAGLAVAAFFPGRTGRGRAASGLAAGVGVMLAYGSSEVIKAVLAQDRPCRVVVLDPSCPPPGSWSFPSNHTTISFALATAMVLVIRSWWATSAHVIALAAAVSRVVDGVHYPHDVLAGAVLGTCTTIAAALLLERWTRLLLEHIGTHREQDLSKH